MTYAALRDHASTVRHLHSGVPIITKRLTALVIAACSVGILGASVGTSAASPIGTEAASPAAGVVVVPARKTGIDRKTVLARKTGIDRKTGTRTV